MRCAECESEPLTPVHYCECCGRELSMEERNLDTRERDLDIPPIAAEPDCTPTDNAPSVLRCGSCGGPIDHDDGDLCCSCQQAFASLLGSTAPTFPESAMVTSAGSEAADAQTVNVEGPRLEAARLEATAAEAAKLEAARAEALKVEEAKALPAQINAAKTTAVRATKEPRRAAVSSRSRASVPSQHRTSATSLAAAVVLAAATSFGVGIYWLRMQQSPTPDAKQQTAVATKLTVPERRVAAPTGSPVPAKTPTNGRQSMPTRPETGTSARLSPGAVHARVPPNVVRQPTPSNEIASVSASSPSGETEPPVVAPTAPQPIAAALPLPEPPTAPRGPFFEQTDVNESPRIATRVEPQLPEDLRNRPVNEIVVVRLLVSQSGHPFRVSLLRRSKAGLPLDDAVIAAVNQWTFSPARKKGEAVSCWYNLGVPVSGANQR